ncbi:MAG: type II secretion system F family protein [Bacterioplanes sp.]|nr:type II secretion system F family protein [Bacterioplanes sp.]
MEFDYRGRDAKGNKVTGHLTAPSSQAALASLEEKQIIVLALDERRLVEKTASSSSWSFKRQCITIEEQILFTRQLYALTKAGVPIIQALTGLAESAQNPLLTDVLQRIAQSLIAGSDMVSAFRQFPEIFSPIYLSMIHIGENTGQMDKSLLNLIAHLELERETRKRMSSALRYPIMVMLAMGVALSVITLFVIPSFSSVFAKLGADLPLATRILMAVSSFAQQYWWLMGISGVVAFFGFRAWTNTLEGGLWWDAKKLRLPLLGTIFERIALGRFSRSLAMMMSAGVPILQSLKIVADSVGNRHVARAILAMRSGVERGDRLTNTASATGLFTPLVLQMMAVGEETGSVDRLLNEVAEFYEQEIDYELKQLADAIEPILLVFMGLLVLMLALGVFLPIWELGAASGLG